MKVESWYPNRVRAEFSASSTDWNIIGTDGTGYATYTALVAAGADPFPGPPTQFPTGVPKLLVRSAAAGNATDGSPFLICTNQRQTPGQEDDLVSGSGQTLVYEDDAIKLVWIKKTAATDLVILTGMY